VSDMSILGTEPDNGREPRVRVRRRQRQRPAYVAPVVSLIVLALVALIAYVGARAIYHDFSSTPDYSGSGNGAATVEVKIGYTADDIGNAMVSADVVKSVRAFRNAASDDPRSRAIQPGRYELHKHMSGQAALALLLDPSSHIGRVTIPEGLTQAETLARLAKATRVPLSDFRAAAATPADLGLPSYAQGRLEGYLFPATYDLPARSSATEILRTMVTEQRTQVDGNDLQSGARELGLTPAQVIVVASLLEQEGITADFPKVARVIYNRLHKGDALQLDSTVNYALGRNKVRVTEAQTRTKSPYNTYLHAGLPPGAISNPGTAAIDAALHPAVGDWLFFVKKDRAGNSFFTADPKAFKAQKKKSQAAGVY
jgi:uncharacterized YceG family protein